MTFFVSCNSFDLNSFLSHINIAISAPFLATIYLYGISFSILLLSTYLHLWIQNKSYKQHTAGTCYLFFCRFLTFNLEFNPFSLEVIIDNE